MTDAIDNPATLNIPGLTDLHQVGQGGYAVVYRAMETDLQRTVAVKVLQPLLTDHAKLRFDRERRAMGALSDHPHVVSVYRGGHAGPAGHQRPYLVMEYLEGGSLAEHLANQGPLPWERVVEVAVQVAGALETAHRAGVLHRDIKPGNIMISALGQAKLGDFGIARLQGSPNTRTGLFSATLTHAPPEVMSGSRPDARADLYSFGSTMYELLAGGPAFVRPSDESMAAIVARIATEKPKVLDERRVPRSVMRAVLDAMAKDPAARPATATDFGERLRSVQRQLRVPPTPLLVRAIDLDDLTHSGQRATVKVAGPPPPMSDQHLSGGPAPSPSTFAPGESDAERSPTVSLSFTDQPTPANPIPIAPADTATSSHVQARSAPPVPPVRPAPKAPPRTTGKAPAAPSRPSRASDATSGTDAAATASSSGDDGPPGAPPVEVAPFKPGRPTPPTHPHRRSRRWLWLVLGLLGVAVIAAAAVAVLNPDLIDDLTNASGPSTTDPEPEPNDGGGDDITGPDDETTPTSADPDDADSPGSSTPGDADGYAFGPIENDDGTVTLEVPTEWENQGWRGPVGSDDDDLDAAPKRNDVQLNLAPQDTSFDNSFRTPGAYLWVDRSPFDDAIATSASGRVAVSTACDTRGEPADWSSGNKQGLVVEHTECPGPDGTTEIIYSYTDQAGEVLVLLVIHAFDERDREAAETIASSLAVAPGPGE